MTSWSRQRSDSLTICVLFPSQYPQSATTNVKFLNLIKYICTIRYILPFSGCSKQLSQQKLLFEWLDSCQGTKSEAKNRSAFLFDFYEYPKGCVFGYPECLLNSFASQGYRPKRIFGEGTKIDQKDQSTSEKNTS